MTRAAQSADPSDAVDDGAPNPPTECGALDLEKHWQPLEIEEQFGVPKGVGSCFRIEAASGRLYAVWAGTEEMAQAAAVRIDRMTMTTRRETFRIAAVPVRPSDGSAGSGAIAKVREIKLCTGFCGAGSWECSREDRFRRWHH